MPTARFSRHFSSLGGRSRGIVLWAIIVMATTTTTTITAFAPLLQQFHPSTTTELKATKIPSNGFNNVPYSSGFRSKGTSTSSTSTSSSTSYASMDCNFSDFLHQDSIDEVERIYQESFRNVRTKEDSRNNNNNVCDVDWTRAAQEVRSYAAWRRPKTAVMQKYNPQFDYGPVIDVRLKP
jgi:hypothetical protein